MRFSERFTFVDELNSKNATKKWELYFTFPFKTKILSKFR